MNNITFLAIKNFIGLVLVHFLFAGLSQNPSTTDSITISLNMDTLDFTTISEWESYFAQMATNRNDVLPENYAKAANIAFKEGNMILSIIWYTEAKNGSYVSPEMYSQLVSIYKFIGDLTEEMNTINLYIETFPQGKEAGALKERLFEMYYLQNNFEMASKTFNCLHDSSKVKENLLSSYFKHQRKNNMKEACDTIAEKLIRINPKNIEALEWLSEKFYRLGESRYQEALKKYEQNKNAVTYHYMTQDFKKSTDDFKKAISYFEVLWEMNPSPTYARYLATIYTRFENKSKVDYYKSFIK